MGAMVVVVVLPLLELVVEDLGNVDLDLVSRELLLVSLPALVEALVALGGRQAVYLEALQDPPHARMRDLDFVIAL